MGKKSIKSLPGLQETNSDNPNLSETARVPELDRYWGLLEALMQQKNRRRMMPKTTDGLLWLHGGWRAEDRDKYLREVSLCILFLYFNQCPHVGNKMPYSFMYFCIVGVRPPLSGSEAARQWLRLKARGILFIIDDGCNHKSVLYFLFSCWHTGNPSGGFFCQ